jgi:hypothetical protein
LKTKHTPGPWRMVECPEIHDEGNAYEIEVDGQTIAHIYASEDMDANARLVSAAPDMLEALKAALLRLDHHDAQSAPEALQCRDAIKKAEGA